MNIKNFVNYKLIEETCINTPGSIRPGDEQHRISKHQTSRYLQSNNPMLGAKWEIYSVMEFPSAPIDFSFIPYQFQYVHWWFVKIMPSYTFPMHTDTISADSTAVNTSEVKRLWIPCQDYISGHIFIHDNTLVTDYRAWDVFEVDAVNVMHGAANLSMIPKYSMQLEIHI